MAPRNARPREGREAHAALQIEVLGRLDEPGVPVDDKIFEKRRPCRRRCELPRVHPRRVVWRSPNLCSS
jgi:hypothetical protein